MAYQPIVGDRYLVTFKQLGSPIVRTEVDVPGLGKVILDEADIHYAQKDPENAAFFVRKSKALGGAYLTVVSRMQKA